MTLDSLHIEALKFNQTGNPQSPGGNPGQQPTNNTNNSMASLAPPSIWQPQSQLPEIPPLDSRLVGNNNKNKTNNDAGNNGNHNSGNQNTGNADVSAPIAPPLPPGPDTQQLLQDQLVRNQYFAQQIDGLQQMLLLQQQQQQQQSLNGGGGGNGIGNNGSGNGGSPALNPSGSVGGVGGSTGGGAGALPRVPTAPSLLPLIGTSVENPLMSVLVDKSSGGTMSTAAAANNNNHYGAGPAPAAAAAGGGNSVGGNGGQNALNDRNMYQQYHVQQIQGSPAVAHMMHGNGDTPTGSPAQIHGGLGPTPNTAAANVLSSLQYYAQQQQQQQQHPAAGGMNNGFNMGNMQFGGTNIVPQMNNVDGTFGGGLHPPPPATAPRRRRGRGGGQPAIQRAPRPRPEGSVLPPRSSQYRGVTKHRRSGRYEAHIWVKDLGRQVYLGGYECEEHAAEAYDIAALKSKGSRTKINFELSKYTDLLGCIDRMTMEELVMAVRRQSQGFSRGTSTYRGVTHHPSGRWEARIGIPGSKHVYLGLYPEEKEAAQAYDRALVRLRGGTAATNFSLAEYRLEMGDYHRMQSRLLRGDPLFTDISANAVLYERWIKNGTEGFPEVESPEMEAAMEDIADLFANGGGGGGGGDAGGGEMPVQPVRGAGGRRGMRSVTRAAGITNPNTTLGNELNEALRRITEETEMPSPSSEQAQQQAQAPGHGPAMLALQKKLAGEVQPAEEQHQPQQQHNQQQKQQQQGQQIEERNPGSMEQD